MINSFKGHYFFLSNFADSLITHEGIDYPTIEHYYVAMKINKSQLIDGVLYDLMDARELISKISTPGKVKRFGRQKLQLREDWESVKYDVMLLGVRQKFKRHEELGEMLLATGDAELVEGNWWGDVYWGVCDGVGENNLGKILMIVRDEVRKEFESKSLTNFI